MSIETTITLLLAAALFTLVWMVWFAALSVRWIYRRFHPVPEAERTHPDTREWPQRRPLGERVRLGFTHAGRGLVAGTQFLVAHAAAWALAVSRVIKIVAQASGRTLMQMSATAARVRDLSAATTSDALGTGYRNARWRSIQIGERTFERLHEFALSSPASSFFDPESIAQETIWRDVASEPVPEVEIRRRSARKVMILRGPALTNFFTWLGR